MGALPSPLKKFEKMNSYNQNKGYWESVSAETKRSNTIQTAVVDEVKELVSEIKNMLEQIEELITLGEVFTVDEEAWFNKLKASFENVEDNEEDETLKETLKKLHQQIRKIKRQCGCKRMFGGEAKSRASVSSANSDHSTHSSEYEGVSGAKLKSAYET